MKESFESFEILGMFYIVIGICMFVCQNSSETYLNSVNFMACKIYLKEKSINKYWLLVSNAFAEVFVIDFEKVKNDNKIKANNWLALWMDTWEANLVKL